MAKTKITCRFNVNKYLGLRFYLILFLLGGIVLGTIIFPFFCRDSSRTQIMRNLCPQALIICTTEKVDPLLINEKTTISKEVGKMLIHYLATGEVITMKQHPSSMYIHLKRITSNEDILFGVILNDNGTLLGIDITGFDVRKPYKTRVIIKNTNTTTFNFINDWIMHQAENIHVRDCAQTKVIKF